MNTPDLFIGLLLLIFCQQNVGEENITSNEVIEVPITERNADNDVINLPTPAQYVMSSPFNNAANINNIIRPVPNNPFNNLILPYCTPIPRRTITGLPIPLNVLGRPTIMCNDNIIPKILPPADQDALNIRKTFIDANSENIDQGNKSKNFNNEVPIDRSTLKINNFSNRNKDFIININDEVPTKHENSIISPDINSNISVKDNASSNNDLSTNKIISEHYKFDSILLNKDHAETNATVKNKTGTRKPEKESSEAHVFKSTKDEENLRHGSNRKIIDTGPALANFLGDKITLNFFGIDNQSGHEDDWNKGQDIIHKNINYSKPKLIRTELRRANDEEVSTKQKENNEGDIIKIPSEFIARCQFWDKGTMKPYYEVEIPNYEVLRNNKHPITNYNNQKIVVNTGKVGNDYSNALKNYLAQQKMFEKWYNSLRQYQNQRNNVYLDSCNNISPLYGVKKNLHGYIIATDPRNYRNGFLDKFSSENGIYYNKRSSQW